MKKAPQRARDFGYLRTGPQMIVGGGVAAMLQPFFGEMQKEISGMCVNPRAHEIALVPARYGVDAGIAGGAALCAQGNGKGQN